MFGVALFPIINLRGDSYKDKTVTLIAPLLFLPSIVMLVLNAILISQLSPQLNYFIQPSSLRMGFFNQLEMSQIQNGTYAKADTFEQQIIGNLGDVIMNTNSSFIIPCSNRSVSIYKDCANASSLTIQVSYLIRTRLYPSYNCVINQANETCASLCTQLLSSYKLILLQEFKTNKVQPAWTGLSKCHTNINTQLTYNSTLNPCSFANKQSVSIHFIFIGILFCIF
jgi:hypothetical protein